MNRAQTFAVILGLAAATAGAMQAEERQPRMLDTGRLATPHQLAAVRGVNVRVSPDLGTPGAQLEAQPAEGRVNPAAFGDFPASVHQASLGLGHRTAAR